MKVEIKHYRSGKRAGTLRKNEVSVDPQDTWSADWTIAQVAHPLLLQLVDTKHGAPNVADDDVPEELKSTSAPAKENEWDTDDNHFKRWDWVLGEMIFAMGEIKNDRAGEPDYHTKRGETVFGEIDEETGTGEIELIGWEKTEESVATWEAYHNRIQNGCRLFGKYFQSLWD